MHHLMDTALSTVAYLQGKRAFLCRRCLRRYPIFSQRRRVIPITQEIAAALEKEDQLGKLEMLPFCSRCYPVTRCEF